MSSGASRLTYTSSLLMEMGDASEIDDYDTETHENVLRWNHDSDFKFNEYFRGRIDDLVEMHGENRVFIENAAGGRMMWNEAREIIASIKLHIEFPMPITRENFPSFIKQAREFFQIRTPEPMTC